MSTTRVAAIQHCASTNVAQNLDCLADLTRRAVADGAQVVTWAEAFAYIGPHYTDPDTSSGGKAALLETLPDGGPILAFCQNLAKTMQCELLLGGFHERSQADRCYNTSVYLDRTGQVAAMYRKIHLFDISMAHGPQLTESRHTDAGDQAQVVASKMGPLGLSICYDLRFPALYQSLVDAGAIAITVPSAFTATTGALHWHSLLRARAIESQCYIIAPAQHGTHDNGRQSYGHSLIIDPWGEVLCELAQGDGFICTDIDPERVKAARREIPSLANRRTFKAPATT